MGKQVEVTCGDCYFRQAGLCALALDRPCPTFRHHSKGILVPPRQAPLVAPTVHRLAVSTAAA